MKRTVRYATFETNSSSSHSLVFGEGAVECPYVLDIPAEPNEDDYIEYDEYLDALYDWKEKRDEVFYMWTVPEWFQSQFDPNEKTLDGEVANKLAALIYLIEHYDSAASREEWARRINNLFVGVDVYEWLGTGHVKEWGGDWCREYDAADILEALSDDDNLARFLFDPETTIVAHFNG